MVYLPSPAAFVLRRAEQSLVSQSLALLFGTLPIKGIALSVCVCAKDTVKYEAHGDFTGGTVVKTPYSQCRGTRSIPGWGTRSRRLRGQKVKQQTTTKIYVRNKLGRNICEIYNKKYAAHEIHYRSALTDEHLQLTEDT